jgi:hypothetical protein
MVFSHDLLRRQGGLPSAFCVPFAIYWLIRVPRAQMTTENETSLLTHLFSLCLKVDDYATDTALIAIDLKMSTMQGTYSR